TWVPLAATLDTNTGSWSSWTDSGQLDVSAAAGGNLFIAFKYTSNSSSAATWEVDNVKISAE
ncbi:MAG: choice-of-anchor J domain-containing protein, partial [Olleya sp.]